jgi:hypothetical protein
VGARARVVPRVVQAVRVAPALQVLQLAAAGRAALRVGVLARVVPLPVRVEPLAKLATAAQAAAERAGVVARCPLSVVAARAASQRCEFCRMASISSSREPLTARRLTLMQIAPAIARARERRAPTSRSCSTATDTA